MHDLLKYNDFELRATLSTLDKCYIGGSLSKYICKSSIKYRTNVELDFDQSQKLQELSKIIFKLKTKICCPYTVVVFDRNYERTPTYENIADKCYRIILK